jgi:hypothetical protein
VRKGAAGRRNLPEPGSAAGGGRRGRGTADRKEARIDFGSVTFRAKNTRQGSLELLIQVSGTVARPEEVSGLSACRDKLCL